MKKYFTVILKVLGIGVLLALVIDISREWIKLRDFNQAPLKITTFDGSNSPYHPSVKYFEKGWNNYKFWMAETPFYPYSKPYRDRNECPSLHVSNDGIHWTEIIKNPLDDLDSIGIKNLDYYSDPHLVQNGDTLECWYRINKRYGNIEEKRNVFLLRKKTTDGVHWSECDTLCNFGTIQELEFVSPAILRSDSIYEMWYVDNSKVFYMENSNPKKWGNAQPCALNGHECKPWHLDVIKADGFYWLLVYDFINDELTLWKSSDKKTFEFVKLVLTNSGAIGSFYQTVLYRSCMLKQSDDLYRIYFSAFNEEITFIGLMEGKSFEDLHVVDIDNSHYSNLPQFLKYYYLTRWRALYFRYRHFKE